MKRYIIAVLLVALVILALQFAGPMTAQSQIQGNGGYGYGYGYMFEK